ncbi:hemagglutinin repeat-containing protein [Campylobacter sp. RM13119]|nr:MULTISPECIES: hemagglutinin repeat-containing protein [unclassified Campylobacter]MBE3606357.1 hemagglutinin repeat-containing protein [Campylobacter sp. RM13119]
MPFFKPNATAPISYSPLNTGFLYRIDSSSSPAFVLGKFDKLYADMNNLILQNFNKYRGYNLNQSSLIIARQDIGIDANGNIYNSGSLAGDNVNLSANSITNKDALILASNDINLNSSNSLNIISSALNAKDINLDSN